MLSLIIGDSMEDGKVIEKHSVEAARAFGLFIDSLQKTINILESKKNLTSSEQKLLFYLKTENTKLTVQKFNILGYKFSNFENRLDDLLWGYNKYSAPKKLLEEIAKMKTQLNVIRNQQIMLALEGKKELFYRNATPSENKTNQVAGAIGFHIFKIPRTAEEFNNICRLYNGRIAKAKQEADKCKGVLAQISDELDQNYESRHESLSKNNVDRCYDQVMSEMALKRNKVKKQIAQLNIQCDNAYQRLSSRIDRMVEDRRIEYNETEQNFLKIEADLHKGRINTNWPYRDTGLTYAQVMGDMRTYLRENKDRARIRRNVENYVLERDPKYNELMQAIEDCKRELAILEERIIRYKEHPESEKNKIARRIRAEHDAKTHELKEEYEDARQEYNKKQSNVEALQQQKREFKEKYRHLNSGLMR